MRRLQFAAALALCLMGGVQWAAGHALNTSYVTVELRPEALRVGFTFHVDDLHRGSEEHADGERAGPVVELAGAWNALAVYLESRVTLMMDGQPVVLAPTARQPMGAIHEDAAGSECIDVWYHLPAASPGQLSLTAPVQERFGQNHTVLVKVLDGAAVHQAVLDVNEPVFELTRARPPSRTAPP